MQMHLLSRLNVPPKNINIKRELNLMVKYVTFNHCNMSSNLIVLKKINIGNYKCIYIGVY